MRKLICLECSDRVALQGDEVRCGCGLSRAWCDPARGGWAYSGPSTIALCVPVHEPEHHRVRERLIEVADDERSHREPLASL